MTVSSTAGIAVPESGRQVRQAEGMRAQVNRVIVAVALLVGLPLVAAAGKVRASAGRAVARGLVAAVARVCGVRFVTRGAEILQPGASYVFVPNHSSPLDIPALLMARPDVQFLAGADLFRFRLLAAAMRALGTRPIDRHDAGNARRQIRELMESGGPHRLVVFAEGGIAPAGERLPFATGAFVLAVKAGASVVPVAIHGTDRVLPPRANLALRPGTVTVEFLPPIPTEGKGIRDRRALRDATRDAVIAALATSR